MPCSCTVTIVNNTKSAVNFKSSSTGGLDQVWSLPPSSIAAGTTSSKIVLTGGVGMARGDLYYYYQSNTNVLDFHVAIRAKNDVSFSGQGVTCEFQTKNGANGTWGAPGQIVEGKDLYVQFTLS